MEKFLKENNRLIAEFMGYIYYHKGIDMDNEDAYCGGLYNRKEIFSKVPIISKDYPDDDQYYFAELPNPDYMSLDPNPTWNTSYETLPWSTINARQYITDLDYHQSWRTLMEVLDKIESLGYNTNLFTAGGDKCLSIFRKDDINIVTVNTSKLEACYKGIVQFIQQYNMKK